MGLLTDPAATKNLAEKIEKFGVRLGVLGFVLGLGWLVVQSSAEFNAKIFIDENALLPGLATPTFTASHEQLAKTANAKMRTCTTADCQLAILKETSLRLRNSFSEQNWSRCDPIGQNCISGKNVIVRSRQIGANVAESIVVNVPVGEWGSGQDNAALGVALSLMTLISRQLHWGKEVFFVFTTRGRSGVQCWLDANFWLFELCESDALEFVANSPQTGVVLAAEAEAWNFVNLEMEGDRGQMTNQDLVNVATRIAGREGIPVRITNSTDRNQLVNHFSLGFVKQLLEVASGEGSGNHADLTKFGIHSITLRALADARLRTTYRLHHYGRLVESILRCENNLLERLHASVWFYIFSSPTHYSSISLYMPTVGLMLLLPTLIALRKWVQAEESDPSCVTSLNLLVFASSAFSLVCAFLLPNLAAHFAPNIIFTSIALANVLPFVFARLVACQSSEALKSNSSNMLKVQSSVLLLFALQCGLAALVCFPQGLALLISGAFVVFPLHREQCPQVAMLPAHPAVLLSSVFLLYRFIFGSFESPTLELFEQEAVRLFWNENSNLYQLWMYSALPVWSALWTTRSIAAK